MGLFTRDIKTFEQLLVHGLQDLYYAENRIVDALPKLIENASDGELKRGLRQHLDETKGQIELLEKAFRMLDQEPTGTKCYGINGLLSEGDEVMGNIENKKVLDAAIISAAQAVEHYEITRYGSLVAWAQEMGRQDVARILDRILEQEKATDQKLTKLAEARVNKQAEGKRVRAAATRRSTSSRRSAPTSRRSSAGRTASQSRSSAAKRRKAR
jgi:ferritin-like metal-binding protein YciE